MRSAIVFSVVLAVGCKDKVERSGPGGAVPSRVEGSGSAAAPEVMPVVVAEAEPPLSADVLPEIDRTPNTRVVIGDGFRYLIPAHFKRVAHVGGHPAFSGTVDGFASPAQMTFWAASAPFKDTLDALVEQETKSATAAGAAAPDVGPVLLVLGGDVKQGYARRMTIEFPDRFELRTVVAHDGRSFIHHCETPNVKNAWANVGTDCITRGTSFHVMPPALTPRSASPAAPPAAAPNVVFFASKFVGTAREKVDVMAWVEASVAQYLKPCLAAAASGSAWKVSFEVGKTGKGGASSVIGGEPEGPADAATAACIAKVVDGVTMEGSASDTVRVTIVFTIR